MMKRLGIIFLLLGMLLPLASLSAPYGEQGKAVTFTQPDGTVIDLRVFGDEFYAVTETLDGYTVVFDHTAKAYVYATLSADGNTLLATAQLAGKGDPQALNVSRHLRITKEEQKAQARERFIRWDAGMGVSAQWESIKSTRRALESAAADGIAMAPPSFTTVGPKAGLTLLIDFDDDPATVAQTNIQAFCNATNYNGYGNNGSVRQYFFDNSNGQLDYTNVVTVYIRIPNSLHPKSWYNDTSKDCGDQGNLLIRDAIRIMTNLPNYNTEILPTFNNLTVDGANQVIACNVFYAGGNGGVWSFGLWPHSWSLYNVGAQSLSPGGKKVFKYQITNIGNSLELGTFCHENGHMLCGFPDIYDYGYDSIGGAGMFCLMNSGGHGANPVQVCAYLKRASGWASTIELNTNSLLTASVSSSGTNFNRFYRYAKQGVATEYYLVENRQAAGRDANLPAGGVAIWHIDELGNKDYQNTNYNTIHTNYEVSLIQADNLWHFQNDVNSGDSKDLYYSGNIATGYANRFSDNSAPSARWWDGSTSGVNFLNFSAKGTTMTFNVGVTSAVLITSNPQSRTNNPGTSASFTVAATGTAPLFYQWQKNSTDIVSATNAIYTIAAVAAGDAGDYRCLVSNTVNAVTSGVASLTVNTAVWITGDPQSRTNNSGTSATFTVTATGTAPLYYQWQKNTNNIVSATNATYTIASVVLGDAGDYRCRVSNMVNVVTSGVASLTVTAAPEFIPLGAQTAFVGTEKTFTVSATGYPAPTLALQGTTASSGYGFTPGTGQLSYTPSQVDTGSQSFTFTASNSLGVATQVVGVTVSVAPVGGGMETFDNFTPTSSSYVSGTFTGQDGSVWTYANVRGDSSISGKTPTIRNRSDAYIRSGTISNGVAGLTFKYRNPFSATAMNNKVYVIGQNSTYTGTVTTVPSTASEVLTFTATGVNVAGDFALLFSNTTSTARIAIDDISWTGYSMPVFSALDGQSATVGVTKVFAVSAQGAPVPVLALQETTASSGYSFTPGTGRLNYIPPRADEGAQTFTFTASNSAGMATQVVNVTVSVMAATVTLSDLDQTYDGTPRVVTAVTVPEGLTVDITYDGSAAVPVNAGTYAVTGTVNEAMYEGWTNGTLTVAEVPLIVTADTTNKIYGEDDPALTYQLTGGALVNGDAITGALTRVSGENAGIYGIQQGTLGAGGNYTLSYVPADLTINRHSLIALADDQSRVYGAVNPALTISYSGFISGEDSNVVDVLPEAGTAADTNSPAGAYAITLTGGRDDNYSLVLSNGTLTVEKAAQTVSFPAIPDQLTTNVVTLSATASSGLAVSFIVVGGPGATNGTFLTFTGSGEVAVAASQSGDGNWHAAPDVTNVFNVTKASALVTLQNIGQFYDGSPRVVTAVTVPEGLAVDITYDGSATVPVNVGTYAVTGTVNEAMYQGWTNGSLTVTYNEDTDGDSLPDWWEQQYFGNITNADQNAMAANGINTIHESYITGLDPNDAQSVFKLTDVRRQGDGFVFAWPGSSGRVYTVYWTSNLLSTFTPMQSNYTGNVFTDTLHNANDKNFYRTEVELAP